MNGTNQNQSLGKSELRHNFIRLTICYDGVKQVLFQFKTFSFSFNPLIPSTTTRSKLGLTSNHHPFQIRSYFKAQMYHFEHTSRSYAAHLHICLYSMVHIKKVYSYLSQTLNTLHFFITYNTESSTLLAESRNTQLRLIFKSYRQETISLLCGRI